VFSLTLRFAIMPRSARDFFESVNDEFTCVVCQKSVRVTKADNAFHIGNGKSHLKLHPDALIEVRQHELANFKKTLVRKIEAVCEERDTRGRNA
jgi:hypothetical protein